MTAKSVVAFLFTRSRLLFPSLLCVEDGLEDGDATLALFLAELLQCLHHVVKSHGDGTFEICQFLLADIQGDRCF